MSDGEEYMIAINIKRLTEALDRVEQAVQLCKWRLYHAPDDTSILGEEVVALCDESNQAATIYGGLAALTCNDLICWADGRASSSANWGSQTSENYRAGDW